MSNSIKKIEFPFTAIPNQFLRDNNISFKAKGLFTYMYSMKNGWNFTIKSISKQQKQGELSIKNAMDELKKHGYIKYKKYSNGKGEYYLNPMPNQENPNQENPNQENPNQENPNQENPNQENPNQENPNQENPNWDFKHEIEEQTSKEQTSKEQTSKEQTSKEQNKPFIYIPNDINRIDEGELFSELNEKMLNYQMQKDKKIAKLEEFNQANQKNRIVEE